MLGYTSHVCLTEPIALRPLLCVSHNTSMIEVHHPFLCFAVLMFTIALFNHQKLEMINMLIMRRKEKYIVAWTNNGILFNTKMHHQAIT